MTQSPAPVLAARGRGRPPKNRSSGPDFPSASSISYQQGDGYTTSGQQQPAMQRAGPGRPRKKSNLPPPVITRGGSVLSLADVGDASTDNDTSSKRRKVLAETGAKVPSKLLVSSLPAGVQSVFTPEFLSYHKG